MTDTMLAVTDLRASYGQVPVLHGLDFEVKEHEVVVLLGANGAGKTTTLRAVCGMVDTKGSVLLDGVELCREGDRVDRPAGCRARAAGPRHVPRADGAGEPRGGRVRAHRP